VKQKPLVSVGMPVYNGEKYLHRALDSLLAQDYGQFELIISDNASTDDTQNICITYMKNDKRVHYSRNNENLGALANFRRVVGLADGEYFMWGACDDQWKPSFLYGMVQELEQYPNSVVAMSAVQRIREDQLPLDVINFTGKANPNYMNRFQLAMKLAEGKPYHLFIYGLYRAEFIKRAISDIPAVAGGDRLFVCQAALIAPFRYVDQVLHIRQISNSSFGERYKSEALGRVWQDFFAKEKMLLSAGPYLLGSPLIPLRGKFLIPLIVSRLALHVLASRVRWLFSGVRYHLGRAIS